MQLTFFFFKTNKYLSHFYCCWLHIHLVLHRIGQILKIITQPLSSSALAGNFSMFLDAMLLSARNKPNMHLRTEFQISINKMNM